MAEKKGAGERGEVELSAGWKPRRGGGVPSSQRRPLGAPRFPLRAGAEVLPAAGPFKGRPAARERLQEAGVAQPS